MTEPLSHTQPKREESAKLANARVLVKWRATVVTAELGAYFMQKYNEEEHGMRWDASVAPQAHFSGLILWGHEEGLEGGLWTLIMENQGCANTLHAQGRCPKR